MMILINGGSSSGKSGFAETLIVEQAKKHDAKGVIVLMTKFCDPEEFDYVPIKRACDAAGLMNLNIEVDRQMVNYEQAATMIQAFKEML